jgi:diguanylate cyclase (GGDEF)-like protein/PAS domain S-box-containing protein
VKLKRYVLGCYAIWVVFLIAAYYGLPGLRIETWGLISLSGVVAIVAGIALNHPARKAPWLVLAAAQASFAAGQLSFLIAAKLGVVLPFPSFADALYLLTFPLYAVAFLIFIKCRSPDKDRRSLIDALTLTAGLALLSWTFLIRPYVHNPDLGGLQKIVAIAYPLGDVLTLALIVRLLAPGTGRTRCVQLLTLGSFGCLVSDVAFDAVQLHGTFHNGTIIDLGWALFYTAWGAASLHPTMATLTEPVPRQQGEVSPSRLALLMLASLIAPVVLLITVPKGPTSDVSVIAVFSAILYLLVLTRLWDAAASHRRALDRERVLRQTGLSLVTAADVPAVAGTVKAAVGALLGAHAQGDALLEVRVDGRLRPATASGDAPPADRLSELAESWLPQVIGTTPILTAVSQLPDLTRTVLPKAESMLLCPVTVKDRSIGDPLIGLIAVFGQRRILADLSATLEILAHQVALTLEGITLRQAVIRQRNEAYFRTLVQDASDAIMIVADDGRVKYATPSTATVFGDIPVEGELFWDLVAQEERGEFARTFTELRERARFGPRFVDQRILRRDGKRVHIQARCSDLRDEPTVDGLVFTLRDVTEQHKLEEEMRHRAFHDALTGLPNRVLLQDRIAQQLASTRRTALIAGVLFVDLDDFKVVNDTLGHSVGDELLVEAAARLHQLVRGSDTAARLGGDEFALLIANAKDTAAVEAAAERVVTAFAEPFALATGLVTSTVTVGVATTLDSIDTDELLRHADLALYAAKSAGKRQWRRYQPVLSTGLLRRRELQEALEEAVSTRAFTLVYQPIVALDTGELAGFEALVRWPHPEWGMMQPGQFITLAEETGQIIAIGAWVLERATADLASWLSDADGAAVPSVPAPRHPGVPGVPGQPDASEPPGVPQRPAVPPRPEAELAGQQRLVPRHDLYVSVNVSARQFADAAFADNVRRVLASSGLESSALTLELTETALLRRDERLHSDLMELKSIGVKLAIDDFGTGYSSLSYLRELPFDVVKMDKSFVDGIADSEQRLALADGIVQIARTLRLEVVAEGIESEVQRDLLTEMGCHYGQGFLLAMPMQPSEAEELARHGFPHAALVPTRRR